MHVVEKKYNTCLQNVAECKYKIAVNELKT